EGADDARGDDAAPDRHDRHPDAPGDAGIEGGPEQPDRVDAVQPEPRPADVQGRRPGRFVFGDGWGIRLNGRTAPRQRAERAVVPGRSRALGRGSDLGPLTRGRSPETPCPTY